MSYTTNLPEVTRGIRRTTSGVNYLELLSGIQSSISELGKTLETLLVGTAAEKPTADGKLKLYFETDTAKVYVDINGTWKQLSGVTLV